MKFKTFRGLVIAGVVVVGAGGLYLATRGGSKKKPQPAPLVSQSPQPSAIPQPTGTPTPSADPAAGPGEPLRFMDEAILNRVAQGIAGDKAKDAVPKQPWKVNLYKDAGQPAVNRLKVDLDSDDKWDEKWTFETPGEREGIKRQVAPADDDKYTVEYRLQGGRWRKPGDEAVAPARPTPTAAPATPVEPSPAPTAALPAGATPLREVDTALLAAAARPIGTDKIKDAIAGHAWKVNLYQDAGSPITNRAKIDLDRDDKWDEKWTFKSDGSIEREVAPADDENYTQRFLKQGNGWVAKP